MMLFFEERRTRILLLALGGSLALACSAADGDGGSESYTILPAAGAGGGAASGDTIAGDGVFNGSPADEMPAGAGGAIADLPEEIEDDPTYNAPVATGHYLWSANPESGRVALIDVEDLSVQVLPAGLAPTYLAPVPSVEGLSQALVLNVGSSDLTRFLLQDGEVELSTTPTHVGANRWSVSQSGQWAVAWSAAERNQVIDPTEGLQEITVVDLSEVQTKATRLTVGYRPSQVLVAEDDAHLVVVSEEGITLIDLEGAPAQSRWIDLGIEEQNRDVSLSVDGNYALVRRSGWSSVDLIDLKTPDDVIQLSFSGPVTDVDLSDSGRAVAIVRQNYELSTFQLAEVLDDANAISTVVIENEIFGSASLTENGESVVVFTNATESDRITIVDLSDDDFLSYRSLSTQSPVLSVTTTPDGKHAAVLGADVEGKAADTFSLLSLDSERFPRVVGTGAPVDEIALGNALGIITATSTVAGVFEAHLVEFPGLSTKSIKLSARPLSVGVLSDLDSAYTAQQHPEGRVTFFDFAADETRTLTGFELSAEVVDE